MPSKLDKPILISSSGSAANTFGNLLGVQITASTAGSAIFSDNTSGSSNELFYVNVPANSTVFLDYSHLGGVPFSSGLYVTLASTLNAAIWIE